MNRRTRLLVLAVILLVGLIGRRAAAETFDELRAISKAARAAMKRVEASVVTIETYGGTPLVKGVPIKKGKDGEAAPMPLRRPGVSPGLGPGTGLVLDKEGWILASAFHFKDEPTTIIVTTPDGTSRPAKLVGRDLSRGVALLRVEGLELSVPDFVPAKSVRVGQFAISIGRALAGEEPMMQIGIISALDRISGRAIQTDALTSPANFGGPLIDIEGRVYGVIVPLSPRGIEAAVRSYDSGIGFAIPIDRLADVLVRLKAGETLRPGYLGVMFDMASTGTGARIASVLPETPAARAGLKKDDVIIEFDGVKIDGGFAIQDAINRHLAGDEIRIRYRRGTEEGEVTLTLAVRPPPRPPRRPGPKEGEKDD